MKFSYRMHHIPTGLITETEAEFTSEASMFRFLNKWNTEGKGQYLYTVKPQYVRNDFVAPYFRTTKIIQEARKAN